MPLRKVCFAGQKSQEKCHDVPATLKSLCLLALIGSLKMLHIMFHANTFSGAVHRQETLREHAAGPLECYSNHCKASLFF